ncbi:MAG: class I tRNA ligase family protein, partial [Candidatus Zixiibacteriota bacterium]
NSLVKEVSQSLDSYEITKPVRLIQNFVIEELSNWYVRTNRRRFWAKEDDPSKMRAYLTLYQVLEGTCRLTAPVSPFISELIWRELHGDDGGQNGGPLSVHMTDYPKADSSKIDKTLEEEMGLARRIVSLGWAARQRKSLKVRQPLSRLVFAMPHGMTENQLVPYTDIIQNELNIKAVETADSLDEYVSYSAKLNFRAAGPKLGKHAKAASAMVAQLESATVLKFVQTRSLELDLGPAGTLTLSPTEVEVIRNEEDGWAVESDGSLTVALATSLTDDLRDEGFAREIVNKVQNMRKASGLEVTDRIQILLASSKRLNTAAQKHREFISRETLAKNLEIMTTDTVENSTEWNINGEKAAIAVVKV